MKKKFSFVLALILACLTALSSGVFFGCDCGNISKWDNLSISNFSKYTALGAGCVESGNKGKSSPYVVYAEENEEFGEVKLIGITGTNECEVITFVNEEGNIEEQDACLIWFDAYTRYSFACFSTDKNAKYVSEKKQVKEWDFYCLSYEIRIREGGRVIVSYGYDVFDGNSSFTGYFFIIDNVTGKIYDVSNILETLSLETLTFLNMEKDVDYIMCMLPENAFGNEPRGLFFINFDGESLKVERRMDKTQFNNFTGGETLTCNSGIVSHFTNDRFGNVFQRVTQDGFLQVISSFTNGLLFQKTDGSFSRLSLEEDEECFLAINNVVYKTKYANPIGTKNNTPIKRWYMNENSEFVEIENLEEIMNYNYKNFSYENNLLEKEDTTYRLIFEQKHNDVNHVWEHEYVLILQSSTMTGVADIDIVNKEQIIYSKTYLDDVYYSAWTKGLRDFVLFNGIVIGKINNETITIDANNGDNVTIFSDYDIKDYFYSNQLDCLKFTAIDKATLLEVEGFYHKDGRVTVGEFPTDMAGLKKIYSIAPLN